MSVLLETCCGSAEDAIVAYKAGSPRVELCSSLFLGGLTPSIGSLKIVKRETGLSVMAMVRPREGGFCYTDAEFRVALEDAETLLAAGADGLVFGFLHEDGTLNEERTAKLVSLTKAAGKSSVFHRAFDVVPDWRETMDKLAELGVTRILTSGQESEVPLATDTIREMITYAAGRIEVMPGGGITAKNAERVILETGCSQIHLAAHRPMTDRSTQNNRSIYYGGCLYPPEDRFSLTDGDVIAGMIARI